MKAVVTFPAEYASLAVMRFKSEMLVGSPATSNSSSATRRRVSASALFEF
jgi:hypothetical protein